MGGLCLGLSFRHARWPEGARYSTSVFQIFLSFTTRFMCVFLCWVGSVPPCCSVLSLSQATGSPPSSLHRLRIPFASLTDALEIQGPGATHHSACRCVCTGYFTIAVQTIPCICPQSFHVLLTPCRLQRCLQFFINESMDAGAKAEA